MIKEGKTMKRKKYFAVLCVMMCFLISVCGCTAGKQEELAEWSLTEIESPVDLHTELQRTYLAGSYNDILSYAQGELELSRPESLRLSWSAAPKDSATAISDYMLEYATQEDFGDAMLYTTSDSSYAITNLYLNEQYYWRVTANFTNGKKSVSPVSTFKTDNRGPRNLYVDGVTNVRDLGGWATQSGGVVKQGMIFRCGRLNESQTQTPKIEITSQGINTMLYEMNVRTEIDLRMKDAHGHESGGITSSPLGDTVQYFNVPLEWDTDNTLLGNLSSVKEFFRLASDESNYPFIFHCNIGTDRTGMFAFLINGLLGVSEEDLYRDYLFSNFASIGGQRTLGNIENDYIATVKSSAGNTLSEKIRNCLVANGIPAEQLDALTAIMTA